MVFVYNIGDDRDSIAQQSFTVYCTNTVYANTFHNVRQRNIVYANTFHNVRQRNIVYQTPRLYAEGLF